MTAVKKTGKISFHYVTPRFPFHHRNILKQDIVSLFNQEKVLFESITYIFCDDDYLLKINQDFLHHDDLTDIITFTLSTKDEPIIGEIYISVERVKENAIIFQKAFDHELVRVVFHGALHLCGYGDKTETDQLIMRKKEDEYLDFHRAKTRVVPRGTK